MLRWTVQSQVIENAFFASMLSKWAVKLAIAHYFHDTKVSSSLSKNNPFPFFALYYDFRKCVPLSILSMLSYYCQLQELPINIMNSAGDPAGPYFSKNNTQFSECFLRKNNPSL